MERQRIKRTWGVAIAGVCLLIPGILLAVCMGAMEILPVDIWNGIFHNTGSLTDMMIRDVRLPRVICVLVTGGILGMTGAMMQGGDAKSDCGTVTARNQSGGDAFCRPSLRIRN